MTRACPEARIKRYSLPNGAPKGCAKHLGPAIFQSSKCVVTCLVTLSEDAAFPLKMMSFLSLQISQQMSMMIEAAAFRALSLPNFCRHSCTLWVELPLLLQRAGFKGPQPFQVAAFLQIYRARGHSQKRCTDDLRWRMHSGQK